MDRSEAMLHVAFKLGYSKLASHPSTIPGSVFLCGYFLLIAKYDWSERKFNKVAQFVHLDVGAVSLGMACAVIPFASPDWRWCYLGTPPQAAAMNSDLLNDDDRQHFRASITIIQGRTSIAAS
jgi:hypothetical protein